MVSETDVAGHHALAKRERLARGRSRIGGKKTRTQSKPKLDKIFVLVWAGQARCCAGGMCQLSASERSSQSEGFNADG